MITGEESELVAKVDSYSDTMITMLKEFISIPTVNPPGRDYPKMVETIQKWCKEHGLRTEIAHVPKEEVLKRAPEGEGLPRPIIFAYLEGGGGSPELHFNGHYDVVPPSGEWKETEPFTPTIREGKLYGRGSTDMKGGLASALVALFTLREMGKKLKGTLSFSAAPDEEIGGSSGVGYMVEKGLVKPDECIVTEPSGTMSIWDSHKGLLWLEVVVRGVATHASAPWLGKNAFERMVKLAHHLTDSYLPPLRERLSSTIAIPAGTNTPTAALGGVVRGGVKVNVIPDYVSFTIDRRLIPEERVASVLEEVRAFIFESADRERIPREDIEIKVLQSSEPCSPRSPSLPEALATVVEDALKVRPLISLCHGGLDMRYFVNAGIPAVTYGPGSLGQAHATDEYIDVEELVRAAKVYALYAFRRHRA